MKDIELDDYIRKKYERTDENDIRGTNHGAIEKFISLMHLHENCKSPEIRSIVENIQNLESLAPNFIIFETEKDTNYLIPFSAYSLGRDSTELVDGHEFGHLVIHKINDFDFNKEKFSDIVKRSKANCISEENKQEFRKYVEHLQDKNITKAEEGPVSDILSSIFQYPSLFFKNDDGTLSEKMIFPSYHKREYYFDEEKGKMKIDKIFDEDFANYYTLVLNGCTNELEILRKFLGDEWMQAMEQELEKAGKIIQEPNVYKMSNINDRLGEVLMTQREGNLPEKLPSIDLSAQKVNEEKIEER